LVATSLTEFKYETKALNEVRVVLISIGEIKFEIKAFIEVRLLLTSVIAVR